MDDKANRAVIILGMHRSGTSVLAGVLSMLGINPGEHLMSAQAEVNPKGFWEHREIVELHDQLFETLDSSWDDISALTESWSKNPAIQPLKSRLVKIVQRDFADSPLWLLKDPRLCRLLPLWLEIFDELGIAPHFIICMRNPYEVVASLGKRDGILDSEAYLLWLRYVLDAERWSRDYSRLIVSYENLLTDWQSVTDAIKEALDIELAVDDLEVKHRITEFIEPGLRHHNASEVDVKDELGIYDLAKNVYQLLTTASVDSVKDSLTGLSKQVDEHCDLVYPWANNNRKLRKQVNGLKQETVALQQLVADQQAELNRIKSTMSWQITKPLRLCANLLRRIKLWK